MKKVIGMRNSRTEAFKIVKASFTVDNLVVDNKGLQAINDYVTGSKTFEQARNTLVECTMYDKNVF